MPPRSYISPSGQVVGDAEACPNGVMLDGYKLTLGLMMMDAAGPGRMYLRDALAETAPQSIDELVKIAIETTAKSQGMKASEWLASARPQDLEKLVAGAAEAFVRSAAGGGITQAFGMDSAHGAAQAVHAAVLGKPVITPLHDATIKVRSAVQFAVLDADPSKAWRNDPALDAGKAMRDAALAARY